MKLKTVSSMLLLLLVCILFTLVSCGEEKEYQFPEVAIPPEYFTNSSYNLENLVDTDTIKNNIKTIYELENGGRAVYIDIREKDGVHLYPVDSYYIVVDKDGKCISDIRYTYIQMNYDLDALICKLDLNEPSSENIYYENYENLIIDIRTVTDGSLLNTFTNSRLFCEMSDYSLIYLYIESGKYKIGVLDKNFNLILEPVYDDITYWSDIQKFAFFKDGKWFFGDEKGEKLTSQTYDIVNTHSPFPDRSPLISVYRDGKYGFVNGDTLEEEIPLIYDLAGDFQLFRHSAYMILGDEIFLIDKYGNRIKNGMFGDCEAEEKVRQYVSELLYIRDTDPREAVISKDDFRFDLNEYMYCTYYMSPDMMRTYLAYESGLDAEYFTDEKLEENCLYYYDETADIYYLSSYQNRVLYEIEYIFENISDIGGGLYEVQAVPFVMEDYIYNENPDKYRIYTFTVRITDGGFIYLEDAVQG